MLQDSLEIIQGILLPPMDSSIFLVHSISCLLGVKRSVIGKGEDAMGNHSSISISKLRDRPVSGELANSSSSSLSAGRTMLWGQASHSCCLCKSNGSG